MNNRFHFYATPYNILKCLPTSIWYNLGINFTFPFQNPKHICFATCTTPTLSFNALCPKVTFIYFHLAANWRFNFAKLCNFDSKSFKITVDYIPIKMGKFTDLDRVQIQRKQLDQLSKFLPRLNDIVGQVRNMGSPNILVSHCHIRTHSLLSYAF
jgi:hypothetical protein